MIHLIPSPVHKLYIYIYTCVYICTFYVCVCDLYIQFHFIIFPIEYMYLICVFRFMFITFCLRIVEMDPGGT